MNEQEFAELSAGAALHALTPDQERRFRSALAVHPEWRAIAREDAEAAAALALPVAPVAPPESIRTALLARIAENPQDRDDVAVAHEATPHRSGSGTPDGDSAGPRGKGDAGEIVGPRPSTSSDSGPAPVGARRGLRLLFALAACIVLLVGIGMGAVALNGFLNRPTSVIALEQIEGAADAQQASVSLEGGGSAVAHWSASLGRAVLVTEDIAAPADDETYELWFLRGDVAVSAGIFSVDGGDAIAELSGEMHEGDAIAVTVESSGGSPTGKPTSDPVIVIPTA